MDINYPKVCGHRSNVMDIAWNPFDEYVIASCSEDCLVKIWRIPEGGLKDNLSETLVDLHGHNRKCGHLQWHPTAENILASSGFDNVIIIWNVATGDVALKVLYYCHHRHSNYEIFSLADITLTPFIHLIGTWMAA